MRNLVAMVSDYPNLEKFLMNIRPQKLSTEAHPFFSSSNRNACNEYEELVRLLNQLAL